MVVRRYVVLGSFFHIDSTLIIIIIIKTKEKKCSNDKTCTNI